MKSEKQIPQSQPALSGTTVIPKPRTETDISLERAWRVVIFNDEITPIDLVVLALQKAAGISLEVAEMITMEAHNQGSAVVRSGITREEGNQICATLVSITRLGGQLPGVVCSVERDT
jgi:ATP-dependent Clp protease adapter protein ClpS